MLEALLPEQDSAYAHELDRLYFLLCAVAGVFTVVIFALILYFAIRFRRSSTKPRPAVRDSNLWMEASWFVLAIAISMVLFASGAKLYFKIATPPDNARNAYVVGKQWMWKVQHPNGRREINQLHVPVGQPVRLTLASEDVIHSFYVPAFRVKMDTVPGRYSRTWFEANRTGTYHLFCAEYCGTNHSRMTGDVIAMEPAAYQAWLAGHTGESMITLGERLFDRLGCKACHKDKSTRRGPAIDNRFGRSTRLRTGREILIDEDYVRESILEPNAKVVDGFDPIMPTFQGQINEEELLQIIAYVKSLSDTPEEEEMP